jgi:hypothetical protein
MDSTCKQVLQYLYLTKSKYDFLMIYCAKSCICEWKCLPDWFVSQHIDFMVLWWQRVTFILHMQCEREIEVDDVRPRPPTSDCASYASSTTCNHGYLLTHHRNQVIPFSHTLQHLLHKVSTMQVKLTPIKDLRVLKHQIQAHGLTPNTSIQNKPLLIYKSAFASNVTAGEIEAHLSFVGVVSPQWRYSMYTTSHFHVSVRLHFLSSM